MSSISLEIDSIPFRLTAFAPADDYDPDHRCSELIDEKAGLFLQCEMSLLMWWTAPAPGIEVP